MPMMGYKMLRTVMINYFRHLRFVLVQYVVITTPVGRWVGTYGAHR